MDYYIADLSAFFTSPMTKPNLSNVAVIAALSNGASSDNHTSVVAPM